MKHTGRGEEYPCRICKAEEAFGRRYLETDEKRKEFDLCLTCARKQRDEALKKFEESLMPEQKELFDKYQEADEHFTSIIILD